MLEAEEKNQLRFVIRVFCYKMLSKVTLLFKIWDGIFCMTQ